MASPPNQKTTLAKFEAFVHRPENAHKRFEFIDGEIVEVPSNPFVSVIASRIITFISMFLLSNDQGISGYVTGEGGGFIIDGQVFAPDVAYVKDLPTNEGYEPVPPGLAVEVISDPRNNTEQTELRRKLAHYMRAGVIVWVVDYVARQVEVHVPDEPVQLVAEGEKLTLPDVLPDFELPVGDLFP